MSMSKFASKDDYYVSKIQERDKAIAELQAKCDALRLMVASYMCSEGCSCCEDPSHQDQQAELCKALGFPKHADGSGYDYWKVAGQADETSR